MGNGSEPEQIKWKQLGLFRAIEATDLSRAEECYRESAVALESQGGDILKIRTWDSRPAKCIDAIGSTGQHIGI